LTLKRNGAIYPARFPYLRTISAAMANTQVILREKVVNLGSEGDVVRVRRGYARNFLVPFGKAYEATKGDLRNLENLKKARVAREAAELAEAEKIATKIRRVKLELELATGASGKAFGSISLNDVVKALERKSARRSIVTSSTWRSRSSLPASSISRSSSTRKSPSTSSWWSRPPAASKVPAEQEG